MTNSYYTCIHCILFYMCVLNFTRVYTCGLMPRVFFVFSHVCDTHVTRVDRLSCG